MSQSKFQGRVAIVTGASSGIGRATALALARQGANVTLAARTDSALQEVAAAVTALDRQALVLPTDVTVQEQVDAMVAATIERWGRVDILIANAGAYVRCTIDDLTPAHVEQAMSVNFYGVLHAVLAVLPVMRRQRQGHIVIVNSVDGKKGIPPDAPYVSSKFALTGFGEVLRQELAGSGINVTSIFPGRVDTPMIETLRVPRVSAKLSPEAVADAIVHAIDHREHEVVIPTSARALIYLNAFSPRLADWFVRVLHLDGWEVKR